MVKSSAGKAEGGELNGYIIGFAGVSGAGKSSLALTILSVLDEKVGPVGYISNGQNRSFGRLARFWALISRPIRLVRVLFNTPCWKSGIPIRTKVSCLSIAARAGALRRKGRAVILDQAHLGLPSLFKDDSILPDFWWPDLVVELVVPDCERGSRLKLRREGACSSLSENPLKSGNAFAMYLGLAGLPLPLPLLISGDTVPPPSDWIANNCFGNRRGLLRVLSSVNIPSNLHPKNSVELSEIVLGQFRDS